MTGNQFFSNKRQNHSVLLGTFQVEALAGVHPGVAGHAAYCIECGRVDAEVVLQMRCDMKANDLAQDHDACTLPLAGEDDLQQLAFELSRRLGDARRANNFAGDGGEPGEQKFVDFRANIGSGGIGGRGNGIGDDVDDEFSGLLDIAKGVFAVVAGGAQGRAEEYRGGIGAHSAEKAEGSYIAHAIFVDSRDQGHRTRHDQAHHQLVDLVNLVVGGIDAEHFAGAGRVRGEG